MKNRIIKIIIFVTFTIILTSCSELSKDLQISMTYKDPQTMGGTWTVIDSNNNKFENCVCTYWGKQDDTAMFIWNGTDLCISGNITLIKENNNEKTKITKIKNIEKERFFVWTDLHYIIMPIGATTFIKAGVCEKTSLDNEEIDIYADNLTWKADNKDVIKMFNSTGNKIIIEAEKIGKTYITVSYQNCKPCKIYVESLSAEDYKKSSPYMRCDLLYVPENAM